MQVKISQAVRMITAAIKANITPMLHGSPGIGKSDIYRQIADSYNLLVIDLRLSQCDPTDLSGFPQIDLARQKAGYVPMDTFPLEGEEPPPGYSGWLLFLDEANSCPKAVQAASYKIMLDRMVGQKKLHKHCAVGAAGNLITDGAIVEEMSTALQSRMTHIELMVDHMEFIEWAQLNSFDHRITDYIGFKPGAIYTFSPDHTDHTYACPRTWEFANRLMKFTDISSPDLLPLLAGTLSEGVAREFLGYCKIYQTLPKIAQIKANPESIAVSTEPSVLYAITGSLAHNMDKDNCEPVLKYVTRLPEEFQIICLKETVRRNKKMLEVPAYAKWHAAIAEKLF